METTRRIDLPHGRPRWIDCRAESVLRIVAGTAWITKSGAAGDTFLRAGESWRPGAGRLLVEGIGDARLEHRLGEGSGWRGAVGWARRWRSTAVSPPL